MRVQRAFGILVVLGLGIAAPGIAQAAPVTVEFPSLTCPDTDDQSLQRCIDGVDPGSTVILVNEIINEGALIEKSLTLRAIDQTLQPRLLGVLIGSPATGAANITVEDIRFSAIIRVLLTTGSGHNVTIRRVHVGDDPVFAQGITVQADVPASITLENSVIRSRQGDQVEVLGLFGQDPSGLVRFRVVGNRITATGDTESGAGIRLQMEGAGSVRADIYNNVIWDVATCNCGLASGIGILLDPTYKANVNIVGNTIENSATDGIQQRNDLTTGRLVLNVFNNILTHNRTAAIDLETGNPGTLLFRGGYNDFFANGQPNNLDGQSAGPGNLNLDPRYVNRATRDLRLTSSSPLINKGSTCSTGGVADPDAAGRHRLNGAAVDIGAFESGGPVITGKVLLGTDRAETLTGTPGADILCGYGGADLLHGGPGADYIDGGAGPDHLIGGTGPDRLLGNLGDDRLCTNDGAGGDFVDGGPGTDKATVDPSDVRISVEGPGGC